MSGVLRAFGAAGLVLASQVSAITVSGTVHTADNGPRAATVSLLGWSYRYPAGSPIAVSTDSATFKVTAGAPGAYILVTEAPGCERLEIPLLLDSAGIGELRIVPRATGHEGDLVPVCSDRRLARWEAIHQAQRARRARYDREKASHEDQGRKGTPPSPGQWPIDWQADLQALSQAIAREEDAPTRSLLALCYMDLGDMGADLDQAMMPVILASLPGDHPFWSANPRSCVDVYNNAEPDAADAFIATMAERHPDAEVRAFALLLQILEASSEYDVEAWRELYRRVVTEYPGTRAAESARKNYDPSTALANGEPFPPFHLTDLDGHPVMLETFRGKVLLVDFWATWCPPCVKEMPEMHAMYEQYHKQGFEILSLAVDESPEKIAGFRKKLPMPWSHVLLTGGRSHPLARALMVSTIPRAFLVGRDGTIIECKRALLKGKALGEAVTKAMTARPSGRHS